MPSQTEPHCLAGCCCCRGVALLVRCRHLYRSEDVAHSLLMSHDPVWVFIGRKFSLRRCRPAKPEAKVTIRPFGWLSTTASRLLRQNKRGITRWDINIYSVEFELEYRALTACLPCLSVWWIVGDRRPADATAQQKSRFKERYVTIMDKVGFKKRHVKEAKNREIDAVYFSWHSFYLE